jgi:hypothetical protein
MSSFNEPELCLMRQWNDARLLEGSMQSVREKYSAVFEKVLDEIQKKYQAFDSRQNLFPKGDGRAGVGKKTWPSKAGYYISGFWLGGLLLENLASETEHVPHSFAWINHPDGPMDLEEAQRKFDDAAFNKEGMQWYNTGWGKGIVGVWCPFRQSRQELFELLTKDEACGFVACMLAHFAPLVQFSKLMDDIHGTINKARQ